MLGLSRKLGVLRAGTLESGTHIREPGAVAFNIQWRIATDVI
jgi:hypothetical protein